MIVFDLKFKIKLNTIKYNTLLFFILYFFLKNFFFAQSELDFYNKRINNSNLHDTAKANAYMKLSDILYNKNIDTIYFLCNKSLKICEKNLKNKLSKEVKNKFLYVKASNYNNLGFYFQYKGNLKYSENYFLNALSIYKMLENKKDLANIYNNLGALYEQSNNDSLSLLFYQKSLNIYESLKDLEGMAYLYNNLSILYQKLGGIELAIKLNVKAIKIREKQKNLKVLATSYINLGYLNLLMKEYKQGEIYSKKGIILAKKIGDDIAYSQGLNNYSIILKEMGRLDEAEKILFECYNVQKKINDSIGLAYVFNNLGSVYKLQNKIEKSIEYNLKSYILHKKINDKRGMINTSLSLSSLYLLDETLNLNKAKEYSNNGYVLSKMIGHPDLIALSASSLSQYYEKVKQFDKALKFNKQAMILNDSVLNREIIRKGVMQQFEYEFSNKEQKMKDEEKKQNIIRSKEKKINFIITSFSILTSIIIGVFLFFMFKNLKKTNKQKKIIEVTNLSLKAKNQEITDSINYAKRIQSAILPSEQQFKNLFDDYLIIYKPKDIVAGDFYWLEFIDNTIFVAVADCTGHGVPGAMVSVVCNNSLNTSVREFAIKKPNEILDKTRDLIINEFKKSEENVKDGMDISLCSLNLKTNLLHWSGANNPLWIIRNGELIEFKPDKQPIGQHFNAKPFTLNEFILQKNDLIFLFSDGFQDQFGGQNQKKYRISQMRDLFLSISNYNLQEQKVMILNSFEKWKGDNEQVDDVCIIALKI